jgi:hypothetical protein
VKVVLLALAAAAAHPQQFDLDCTGPDASGMWKQASIHLRVDTARGEWCDGECKALRPIADVQPTVLWLDKSVDAEDAAGQGHFRTVDRESGEYTNARMGPGGYAEKALCTVQPFSGFPTFDTKF